MTVLHFGMSPLHFGLVACKIVFLNESKDEYPSFLNLSILRNVSLYSKECFSV